MDWKKLLYVLVITLLYVPMVFLGANVFFPEYTGSNSWFQSTEDCYLKYPYPAAPGAITPAEQATLTAQQEACNARVREEQKVWEEKRAVYNGNKYAGIVGFNLLILLMALFIPWMEVVRIGLFFGAVVTAFGATVNYWDYARSKLGFGLMVVVFFVVLWFVNKWAKNDLKK
jgi:hypothetical protein